MDNVNVTTRARTFLKEAGPDFARLHVEAARRGQVSWAGPYVVRQPLGSAWEVAYSTWVIRRMAYIGEVHVFPRDPTWTGDRTTWSGNPALIPDAALTARLLHQLAKQVGRDQRIIRAMFSEMWHLLDLDQPSRSARPAVPGQRRGRPGRSDLELIAFVKRGLRFVTSPRSVQELADSLEYTKAKAAGMLFAARERGLALRGAWGQAEWGTTAKANAIWAAASSRQRAAARRALRRPA